MFIFAVIFYLVAAVVVAGILYVAVSGIITLCRKIFTENDVKIAIIAAVIIAIVLCVAISPAASRAEELPEGFYHKVVFIDEVEEAELDRFDIEDGAVAKFLLHTDDLDHMWDYWDTIDEDEEEFIDYEFDRELSNLVLYWARENEIDIELDKEQRIVRGRILVLTMWECTEDPLDDEVWDVYYSEFTTW